MCEAVTMLDMPDTITETLTTAPVERSTTRVPVPVPAVATGKGNFGDFGDVVARMNLRNYHRSSRFFDSMFQNCIRLSLSVGRTCMCVSVIFEWIILTSRRSQIRSRSLPLVRYRVNQSGFAGSFHPSCAAYASAPCLDTCTLSMGKPRCSGKTCNSEHRNIRNGYNDRSVYAYSTLMYVRRGHDARHAGHHH